ncbi:vomeronasal type-1 receptor 4-like [Trichosurus vulpecula]|uniref:vomeronasal type-1 receptor 4-like n=1 Tax=Trichosurus vulpecula TaxID=9337 RepID=UPI00186AF7A4|nr:vomeronasal type-1 receptor 4-like [Trichosurus vulpecula]
MQSYDGILCIFYLLQIIITVFGNVLLLYLYSFNLITSQKIRPIGVIVINLAFSHIMMILFRAVPSTIQVCIQKIFLNDIECKIIIYLQRVSRGLSLCNTCLLSIFQAIAISSSSPKWAQLKARAPKWALPSCVFIWVLNLLTDVVVPLNVSGPRNDTMHNLTRNLGYCYIDWHAVSVSKLVMLKTFNDAVFLGIMAITSAYMVLVLFRHHWQVQHLHNTRLNPVASPETKATKVILLLMIIFLCFYSVASIFIIVLENSKDTQEWMINIPVILTSSYSTISPFVLISNDSQIFNCYVFKRLKNSHSHSLRSQNKLI